MNKKSQAIVYAVASALLVTTLAQAQVTLTDIGATAPTPGTNDIYQLSNGGGVPPSLNYYWDDGATTPGTGYPSQTFTTLSNPQGYTLTSVAIQTGGGGGGGPTQTQPFTLLIFSLNGAGLTNATQIASYTVTGTLSSEGDWMQWTGLGTALAPGTNYGFAFGRAAGSPGDWEEISTATGLPYAGGQACLIPDAGGKIKFSSSPNTYDMTFDIGLALPAAPIATPPGESPASANLGILAGTTVTLTASAAGSTPISYQWQTDGGSGGTLTNIPGATGTNLVVNTTGFAAGAYRYDFVATNSLGSSTSSAATITIVTLLMEDIGGSAPTPGANDISQLLNTQQNDDGFNYYTDNGANNNEWNGQTFTTGANAGGYLMNSLAWKSAGNGNSFPVIQLYDLYIYSLSGTGLTNATRIASYQAYGGGTQLDWIEWFGLHVPMAPNTTYAYAFGRDATSTGWEHIGDQAGNPYAGGQLCQIPSVGGMVTYGNSGASDATFDIGLTLSQAAFAGVPTYSPNVTPIYAGTAVTLTETAVGTQPLYYQWLADNGTGGATWTPLGGATQTNLVVNTTGLAANNYEYEVIVTNSFGASTSAPVTLTVIAASAPIIVTDTTPTNQDLGYVGQTLTFSATFAGTLPISYQWYVNTGSGPTLIPAASNSSAISNTLVLANLQLTNAGTYTVAAVNSVGGPISSTASTLTVLPDPAAPASGTYAAQVLSDSPIAFWQLNDTNNPAVNAPTAIAPAYDFSGNNFDGLYGVNAQNGFDGIPGPQPPAFPGFQTNDTALAVMNSAANSFVTVPPLNLGTNAVTITMWINPQGTPPGTFAGLFFNRNGNDGAGLGFGGSVNGSGMPELGYTWNTNNSATWGFNSGLYPVSGDWSFVALVIQSNQATIYLYYVDAVTGTNLSSAVNAIPHGPEGFSGGTTWIGDDQGSAGRTFNGYISDVAVFNTALTVEQLVTLFGKGTGVSLIAPSITGQPQSLGVYAGRTAKFTATGINGTPPLTYQWQLSGTNLANGGNVSGVTTPSLTISNATTANAGSYQLLVTGPGGVTPSSVATLSVFTVVPGSYESAVLADNPLVYWKLDETNDPGAGGVLAYDLVSGLNGVYETAAQNGFNGILGPQPPSFPGFPTNYTAMETFSNTANSYVAASAGTLVASNLTYAMWINPSGPVENWAGLLMDRGGVGEGFGFGGSIDATGMSELGYTWNQNSSWSWDTFLFPPTNLWSFVAMVIEPSQATIYLINANGAQSAVNAISQDSEEFGVAWRIGDDAQDGGNGGRTFPGIISSVSVYLSALSSSQVTALYDAGLQLAPPVTLNVTRSGAGSLTLTWPQGTLLQSTNVAGPWSTNAAASSPYTVAPTNSQTFFKVRVK
jgi:hypothetical protein